MIDNNFWYELYQMFKDNRGKAIGAMIGFFFGVLILVIGFFKTLLLLICTAIGYFVGSRWDIEGDLKKILNRILPPRLR